MSRVRLVVPASLFGMLAFALAGFAQSPPPVPAEEGLEHLGRGPVHEGFAQPFDLQPVPAPVAPREAPAPLAEAPPAERPAGADVQWIPGYWQWDDERKTFIWISGVWRKPPPGRRWAPGAYVQTELGWQRTPGLWVASSVVETQYCPAPPAVLDETPPPPPATTSTWVPGCWVYANLGFRWRPGYYVAYQPGWVWSPSHWRWTPAGYVYVSGYWDTPLGKRGWLYAPCAFAPNYRFTVGYRFAPRFVVSTSFLTSSLFVRGGWGHYYYGDYYRDRGFTPFVSYRVGRYGADPLYGYYRHAYKPDRLREIHGLYEARLAGRAPLPPRTWAQQEALLRSAHAADVRRLTALARPGQFSTRPPYRVPPSELVRRERELTRGRELAVKRREIEHQLRRSAAQPLRAGEAPRVGRLPVVSSPSERRAPAVRRPPARPKQPASKANRAASR